MNESELRTTRYLSRGGGGGESGDFGDYTVFRGSVGESVVAKRVERVDYEKLSANQLPIRGRGEGL